MDRLGRCGLACLMDTSHEPEIATRITMHYTDVVPESADWAHGAAHMWDAHRISPLEADEALADPMRVVITPDYNSISGRTARTIGRSRAASDLLSIITLEDGGITYGVNGWRSNTRDRRLYQEGQGE